MIRKFPLLLMLIIVLLTSFSSNIKSKQVITGRAYARLYIEPIGYSDSGIVLCKTVYSVDEQGAHSYTPVKYGYLLVSAKGVWKEINRKEINDEYDDEASADFKKEFYARLDFRKPPAFLDTIIRNNHIERHADEIGQNQYYWTPKGIYNGRDVLITSLNRQTSINGIKNVLGKGTRVPSTCAIKGVLFFSNEGDMDDENGKYYDVGAKFLQTEFTWPINHYSITGICILKRK
jgi:hypothetical protein